MIGFSLKPVNSFSSFFLLSPANSETKRRDIPGFVKTGDPGPGGGGGGGGGVLTVVAYTGRLCPKGVSFSGF